MAVALKRQKDGVTWRPYWYGVYTSDGRRRVVSLGLRWQGSPPESGSLRDPGDDVFEASRAKAEEALAKHRDEARRKGNAAHLVERLIEEKTGQAVKHVKISELAGRLVKRRGKLSAAHLKGLESACKMFQDFMAENRPDARFLYQTTPDDAHTFFESLQGHLAPRTAHGYTATIRGAFRRHLPEGVSNPFEDVKLTGASESVHRRPFTAEELRAILDAARDDEFMFPLIVAAACTGMRRGDVCRLQWTACDLAAGMVTAKASKTGEPVEIPLFEPLRAVVEARAGNGSKLVFPEAARMLAENPHGLTWRFKKIVAIALSGNGKPALQGFENAAAIEAEARAAILANVPEGERRARILDTFKRYAAGKSVRVIETETGESKGTISNDLHAVERWTGKRFIRSARGPSMKRAIATATRASRQNGRLSASVYDWHALRTTFVTLALTAGVPMELVRRVTGHATVDVVLKHYFRPGREDFKAALQGALPAVLTGLEPEGKATVKALSPAEEMTAILGKVQDGTATDKDRARLRELAVAV